MKNSDKYGYGLERSFSQVIELFVYLGIGKSRKGNGEVGF